MVGIGRVGSDILGFACAKFVPALDVGSLQAASARGGQVVLVRRHQHDLAGHHIKHFGNAQISVRVWLVRLEHLSRQHAVPGQARALGHVGQEAEVAVGQAANRELGLKPCQTGNGVGPGVQPVPHFIQVLGLRLVQMGNFELGQDPIQNHAVQVINEGPRQLPLHHAAHGRLVTGAPGQGKFTTVYAQLQGVDLCADGPVPVHYRAKNVKSQNPG